MATITPHRLAGTERTGVGEARLDNPAYQAFCCYGSA